MPPVQGTVPNFQQLGPWNLRLLDSLWPENLFALFFLFTFFPILNVIFLCFFLSLSLCFIILLFVLFLPVFNTSFLFCLYPTLSFPLLPSYLYCLLWSILPHFLPQFFFPTFISLSSFIPLSVIPVRRKTLRIRPGLACHRSWDVFFFPAAPSFIWQVVIEA